MFDTMPLRRRTELKHVTTKCKSFLTPHSRTRSLNIQFPSPSPTSPLSGGERQYRACHICPLAQKTYQFGLRWRNTVTCRFVWWNDFVIKLLISQGAYVN